MLLYMTYVLCLLFIVMAIHGCHGYTWLDLVGPGYTWLDLVIHGWTWLYMVGMVIHGYTWLYMVIPGRHGWHGYTYMVRLLIKEYCFLSCHMHVFMMVSLHLCSMLNVDMVLM